MRSCRWIGVALAVALALPVPAAETSARAPHGLDYGEVLYQFYQGRYFTAITHLRAAQAKQVLGEDAGQGALLLGGLYLGYRMHGEAERLFQRLLAQDPPPDIRDRAWFWLGKVRYRRGLDREALAALARVGDALPQDEAAERRVMEGVMRLRQQDNGGALAALIPDEAGEGAWSPYVRFNRAVALLRSGRGAEAEALLDTLGSAPVVNEEQKALRDRANFALGMHLLGAGRNPEAKAVLQRVRLEALQSNQALLAAGWSDAKEGRLDMALVPWKRLARRPLREPAVADALLAVPYALSRLGGQGAALSQYRAAEGALTQELDRLRGLEDSIAGGRFLKSVYVVTEEIGQQPASEWLALDEAGRDLAPLLADNGFREALQDYLDLAFLKRRLEQHRQSVQTFGAMLAARRMAYARQHSRVQAVEADARQRALRDWRDALQRRLDAMGDDALAFATDEEQAQLGQLNALRERLKRLEGHAQYGTLEARRRLLEGVLIWRTHSAYSARKWAARKGMRGIDRALRMAQTRSSAIRRIERQTPADFDDFEQRIDAAGKGIARLLPKLEAAQKRQRAHLQRLAAHFVKQRRARLRAHLVQARFALAQIYDQAATGGAGEEE